MMASSSVPWWAKIAAKVVLSRLPLNYGIWKRLGLFRHGSMDNSGYARNVFDTHVHRAGLAGKLRGKTVVELGPGDSAATAVVAAANGAHAILVDTGAFAEPAAQTYVQLARRLADEGLRYIDIEGCRSLDEVLIACGARYLTSGLKGLRELPAASTDLIFSHAVLEHVRKTEFSPMLAECRRVLKHDGVFSSHIDLQDHLGGALDNLRFPEWLWESSLFSASGFYTNRLRYGELLNLFRDAGFTVEVTSRSAWDRLPTPLHVMQPEFNVLPDEELRVLAFSVVLRQRTAIDGSRPLVE